MESFKTDSGGTLELASRPLPKTEEELRDERSKKFVALLDQSGDLQAGEVDTITVRREISQPEDVLDREGARRFREGFERLMQREASKR